MKEQTVKRTDGTERTGTFRQRRKGITTYLVIENLIMGINNPIGHYFNSREEADRYLKDNGSIGNA